MSETGFQRRRKIAAWNIRFHVLTNPISVLILLLSKKTAYRSWLKLHGIHPLSSFSYYNLSATIVCLANPISALTLVLADAYMMETASMSWQRLSWHSYFQTDIATSVWLSSEILQHLYLFPIGIITNKSYTMHDK